MKMLVKARMLQIKIPSGKQKVYRASPQPSPLGEGVDPD